MPGKALYQWVGWCGAAFAIALLGCAGAPVSNALRPVPDTCVIAHATGEPVESLTIALPAHSVTGWNEDPITRLIDALLYEPFVRFDCHGAMIPALAEAWHAGPNRTWTFTIRDGAQLSDGTPVTVRDIVASWRIGAQASHGEFARFVADSARILDARTIVVALPDTSVRLLSDPAFSLRVRVGDGGEFVGTGAYRLVADSGGLKLHPGARFPNAPRIRLARSTLGNARDMLDDGADLLVTEDPSVVRYATAHPELDVVRLPLQRVYVLVAATDSSGIGEGSPAAALRAELARDVVPARARAAEDPYWWNELPVCALSAPRDSEPAREASRIVHHLGDPVARAIAQRLVALASGASADGAAALEALAPALRSTPTAPVALGLPPEQFLESLRAANEVAYIVPLPVRPFDRCAAMRVLGDAVSGGTVPARMTPLVEAGGWTIVRRARVNLELDWDGSIHLPRGRASTLPRGGASTPGGPR